MMNESYKNTFNQFERMANYIIEEGTPLLVENLEAGDWMKFNLDRLILDEANLTPKDQQRLEELDRGIAHQFTPALLDEYARFQDKVYEWWGPKE